MELLEHPLLSDSVTDVAQFFIDITEAYLGLEKSTLHLLNTLPAYNPEQILHECRKLGLQHGQLASLDRRLFEIIDLAGAEIVKTHMVHDYRIAFAKALMATNILHQKLRSVKAELEQNPQSPRTTLS